MDDEVEVCCPYCCEWISLYVDPHTRGELIQDCDVCCRPWRVFVARDEDGQLAVTVDRA
ncbi:MAG: CPXCG motif-containing cysteine-rich protein [Myxococcales bacterium]|nr:CPXCG motif-containing cysteine-rich protein [Myxococcales bacterium]MCB9752633.1 CPXCG motif-containing cysteine-rich protein [Myxococcales bacterium]